MAKENGNDINWHISYEQAEAQIHDTVNRIYEHNLNDPTMTQDEAIQSTGQSAEKGLTYLDEFQAEMEAQQAGLEAGQEGSSVQGAVDGVSGGTEGGTEGGLDGGADGGGVDGGGVE